MAIKMMEMSNWSSANPFSLHYLNKSVPLLKAYQDILSYIVVRGIYLNLLDH